MFSQSPDLVINVAGIPLKDCGLALEGINALLLGLPLLEHDEHLSVTAPCSLSLVNFVYFVNLRDDVQMVDFNLKGFLADSPEPESVPVLVGP